MATDERQKKRSKEQKIQDWTKFMEKLRNTPEEKLSKAAKWVLKDEAEGREYWMDMKAVLK